MSNEDKAVIKQRLAEKAAKDNKKEKKKKRNIEPRTIHLKKSEGTASLYDWVHSLVFAVAIVVIILTFFLQVRSLYYKMHPAHGNSVNWSHRQG